MDITFPSYMIWWISAIDLPLTAAIIGLFWKTKKETDEALNTMNNLLETRHSQLRDSLSAYKLEVAKSYTSIGDTRALEARLVSHLLRIEEKLDRHYGAK